MAKKHVDFWLALLNCPNDVEQQLRYWNGYLAWKLPDEVKHAIRNVGHPPFNQFSQNNRLALTDDEKLELDDLAEKNGGHPQYPQESAGGLASYMDFSDQEFVDGSSFGQRVLLRASFKGATFEGKVDFKTATFIDPADFEGAIFKDRAQFDDATFENTVYFKGAKFKETAVFNKSTFKAGAYFQGVLFLPKEGFQGELNRPGFTGERLVQILGCFFMCVQGFIEHLLCFVRRDISDGAVKTLGVVPIDPFQRFPFKLAH